MGTEIIIVDADDEIIAHHANLIAIDKSDHALMQIRLNGERDDAASLDDALAGDITNIVGLSLLTYGIRRRIETFAHRTIGCVEPLELLGEVAY